MMKKFVNRTAVFFLILCLAVSAFACSGGGIDVEGRDYTVELGENFELPQATASDGGQVTASVKAPDGSEVAVSYGMFYAAAVGNYQVTFRTEDSSAEKKITVTCRDTQGPRITVSNVPETVNEGEDIVLPAFSASDLSGVTERSVKLYAEETADPVAEGSGSAVTAIGSKYYRMVFTAMDGQGNESVVTKRIDVNSQYSHKAGFGSASLEIAYVTEDYPPDQAESLGVSGAVARFAFAGGDGSKTAAVNVTQQVYEYSDGKFFAVTMYVPDTTEKLYLLRNGESTEISREFSADEFVTNRWFLLELPFAEIDPSRGDLSGFGIGAEGTGELAFYIASVVCRDRLDNFTAVGYGDPFAYSVNYVYDGYPAPNETDGLGSGLNGVYTYSCNYQEAGAYEAAFRYELDEMKDYGYYDYIRLLLYVPEETFYLSYGQASGTLTPSIDPSEASKVKRNVWFYEYLNIRDFIAYGNSVSWFAMFFGAHVPDGGLTVLYIGDIEYVSVPLAEQKILSITGGTVGQDVYQAGTAVNITPDLSAVPEGKKLGYWLVNGEKVIGNTFYMPNEDAVIQAVYVELDNIHNQIGKVSTVEYGDASQIAYEWVTEGLPEGYEGAGAEKFTAVYAPLDTFSFSGITIALEESYPYGEDKALVLRAYVPEPYTDLAYMSYYAKDSYYYGWGDAKTGHCRRMAYYGQWADYVIPFNQISAGLDVSSLNLYFAFKGQTIVYLDSIRAITLEEHGVTVSGGSADVSSAKFGVTVTITQGEAPAGKIFRYWTLNGQPLDGNTFEMPNGEAVVEAVYKDYYQDDFSDSFTAGSAWPLNGMPNVDFLRTDALPEAADGSTARGGGAVVLDGPWATAQYTLAEPVKIAADRYLKLRVYQDRENMLIYLGNIGATDQNFTHKIGYAIHGADIEAAEYNIWSEYYFPLTDFGDAGSEFAGFIIGSCSVLYVDEIEIVSGLEAHSVTVTGGTADVALARAGQMVTLTADAAPAGQVFAHWTVNGRKISGNAFYMPDGPVTVTAEYAPDHSDNFTDRFSKGSAFISVGMPQISYVWGEELPASSDTSTANGGAVKIDGGWASTQYTFDAPFVITEANYLRLRIYQPKENFLVYVGFIGVTDSNFTYQIGYQIHGANLVAETYDAWVVYDLPLRDFGAIGSEFPGFVIASCGTLYLDEVSVVELAVHSVTVTGGISDRATARAGETVTLTPAPAPENKAFDHWTLDGKRIVGSSFRMPDRDVTVAAVYKDYFADDLSVRMTTAEPLGEDFRVEYVTGDRLPASADGSTANDGGAVMISGGWKDVDYRFETPVEITADRKLRIRIYQPSDTVIVYLKRYQEPNSFICLIGQELHGADIVAETYDGWVEYTIALTEFGAEGTRIEGIGISSTALMYVDEISVI